MPRDLGELWILFARQYSKVDVQVQKSDSTPIVPVNHDWDGALEFSVHSVIGLAVEELVEGESLSVTAKPGDYRIRLLVGGRTRAAALENALSAGLDAPAAERLLVQIWPSVPQPSLLLWDDAPTRETLQKEDGIRERAQHAARAIITDVVEYEGVDTFSKSMGTVRFRGEFDPGEQADVFHRLTRQMGWPWAQGGGYWGAHSDYPNKRMTLLSDPYLDIDHGEIRTHITDSGNDQFHAIWSLFRDVGTDLQLVVDSATLTLSVVNRSPEEKLSVLVEHSGVPAEWVAKLRAQWELIFHSVRLGSI
ncbi:hypothetical protein K8W59_18255 [Nocardioides rotundus]|uniref:hypothetical protein n=1 Tax=Nocardioides rotundus TaxID=1774216 RepID=UPI001CBE7134|nr:hypothetical protein [Nocardioides rotundus]UAL29659.1 hypothetical protein K8W59_18255 [Nocardioides rotundus]